jgi:hypothetical protein
MSDTPVTTTTLRRAVSDPTLSSYVPADDDGNWQPSELYTRRTTTNLARAVKFASIQVMHYRFASWTERMRAHDEMIVHQLVDGGVTTSGDGVFTFANGSTIALVLRDNAPRA